MQSELITQAKVCMGRTHYQASVSSGNHTIVMDEPVALQGTDTGISPMALLLASLGGCTSITLRMYIDRKMWIVDEINIDLALYKVPGGTMISRNIEFKGELSPEQKKRLEQIADACPVHKILVGDIMVDTRIA
jgi:putative redox protein